MKANSDKSKQRKKATCRVLARVLCGASVLSLVLSLVMPPISQAIANDAQTVSTEETVMGGGSSSESTDVDNTNNGDTENQNSDETEGDEAGDDSQPEEQPEEEQQNEGTTTSDGETVAAVAENERAGAASDEMIDSASMLKDKLENAKGTANFQLTKDIDTSTTIQLEQKDSNITLDLNGHKIKYTSPDQPLFNIIGGATLTIKDTDPEKPKDEVISVKQLDDPGQNLNRNLNRGNYGKDAKLSYDNAYDNGIPSNLIYYVTQSSPSKTDTTKTTETLYKHSVDIKGAIVACGGNANLRLINLYNKNGKGGTFNLVSGVITQKQGGSVSSLVYAEGGSTVNMSGGYVCGASGSGASAGIMVSNNNGGASTLDLTGGVIAGNSAYSGGGVYARYSEVTITNGVISGNSTLSAGLGGGIMAEGGIVTVSGGYITNNRMAKFCNTEGSGCHGGAGLAANNGAHVTISGGQITGNYSEEAGGGVYVTNFNRGDMAWLDITGGYIASNVSFRSEGAGIRVGQKVDAMIGDTPDNNGTPGSKVYITNNCCMSRFDWGGGGIFVQGDSKNADNAGRLFVYNSYISSNTAGGYGGGVAVCPTGKTLVTNTKGTAIFGNSSAGDQQNFIKYNREDGSGNNGTPHLSGGGIADTNKTEDREAYNSPDFRKYGHADFFLAAREHTTPVAVVSGKMFGDIDAKYSGSIELKGPITIPANGVAQVKNSIGLTSGVDTTDKTTIDAVRNEATTFITDNYSWNHGGGIMSNGDLYLGQPADTYVYPSLKLKATKALSGRKINKGEFSFTVYRKDSVDPFASGVFNHDVCTPVGTASNVDGGNITFNLGEQSAANGTAGTITYYLVENAGKVSGITYDPAVYEIKVTVEDHSTVLMTVPTRNDPNKTIEIKIHNYEIKNVSAVEHSEGKTDHRNADVQLDAIGGYYSIGGPDGEKTFTNTYDPEVSWTPKATKVVKGGEMKKFTLQLATDSRFRDTGIIGTAETTSGKDTKQTLSFKDATDKDKTIEFKYSLSDIRNNSDDPGGSTGGSFKTFTYYVREKTNGSQFSHYTYDQSVYKFTVVPTYDTEKGEINCRVTYMKGSVDSKGDWTADPNAKERTFIDTSAPKSTDTSIPTFTNTYSTSLPLSGMSGVTLTYLAGAAVLCAAAAWIHIRRKANAKGGERRE